MIEFTRKLAKEKVTAALEAVADFNHSADIEQFDFSQFHDFHKNVFLITLKNEILNIKESTYYFDVSLSPNNINEWATVKECIDYLVDKTTRYSSQTGRLQL